MFALKADFQGLFSLWHRIVLLKFCRANILNWIHKIPYHTALSRPKFYILFSQYIQINTETVSLYFFAKKSSRNICCSMTSLFHSSDWRPTNMLNAYSILFCFLYLVEQFFSGGKIDLIFTFCFCSDEETWNTKCWISGGNSNE